MDDQLEETEFDDWKDHKDGIAVLSGAEWEKATDIRANYLLDGRKTIFISASWKAIRTICLVHSISRRKGITGTITVLPFIFYRER